VNLTEYTLVLAVKNFGLLWERKYIYYGGSGVSGHLLGSRSGIEKADFRKQRGVYVLYDKDMLPVYVGQAGKGNANLFSRLGQHETDHLWNRWNYFSWFGLCKVNKDGSLSMSDNSDRKLSGTVTDAMDEIEGILILAVEPKLNKQGAKMKGAEQFHQDWEENNEDYTLDDVIENQGSIEARLTEIEKLLKK
jgi:hypothetical protein